VPLHIAYLIHHYPAVSQAFVRREVEELRRRGVRVDMFTVWRTAPGDLLAEADRIEDRTTTALLPVDRRRVLAAHLTALRRPRAYVRTLLLALRDGNAGVRQRALAVAAFALAVVLWNDLRRRGIRHVHTHFTGTPTHIAWLTTELGNAFESGDRDWTFSLNIHGPVEFHNVAENRLRDRIHQAAFVVAISDFARSQLMAFSDPSAWHKIRVIRSGIELDVFRRNGRAPASGDQIELLSIGRLVGLKGQSVLLDAVSMLRDRGVRVHATIGGDGEMRAPLERQAAKLGLGDVVSFIGAVGQDEILSLYGSADIFCMSSFAEGIPGVLQEAMAMEVPVIATRIAGISELVEDGENGLLVPPGRSDRLADALERLARDPELREQFARAGRRKVESNHDLRQLGVALADLIAEFTAANSVRARGAIGAR
jgi:colanic acid/amylovoran biosynthesis glycosyltransferase